MMSGLDLFFTADGDAVNVAVPLVWLTFRRLHRRVIQQVLHDAFRDEGEDVEGLGPEHRVCPKHVKFYAVARIDMGYHRHPVLRFLFTWMWYWTRSTWAPWQLMWFLATKINRKHRYTPWWWGAWTCKPCGDKRRRQRQSVTKLVKDKLSELAGSVSPIPVPVAGFTVHLTRIEE